MSKSLDWTDCVSMGLPDWGEIMDVKDVPILSSGLKPQKKSTRDDTVKISR